MTERLFQRDSYLKTFDARVTAVRPEGVVLDRTAFFPTGGGVLGDTGALTGLSGSFRVVETVEDEGGVFHRLERAGLAVDDAVQGELEWARRYLLMRYHTATHVLTGVMFNDFHVRVTGNQLTPDKGRVDFAFEQFDRDVLEEGFRRANAIVARDLAVRVSFVPAARDRARALSDAGTRSRRRGSRHGADWPRRPAGPVGLPADDPPAAGALRRLRRPSWRARS